MKNSEYVQKFVLAARKESKNCRTDLAYGQKPRFITRREARQVVRNIQNKKPLSTGNNYASSASSFARLAKETFAGGKRGSTQY